MVRRPAVAGQFYPGTEEALISKIEECFTHEIGPGQVPKQEGKRGVIKGIVAPHAGYEYSGPVAAHSYKALYEDGFPSTVIILGPNHHGLGSAVAIADEDFKTPLGTVQVDKDLVQSLSDDIIQVDNTAHREEHSLEVQIPFLQYFSKSFKIVPICFNKQDYKTVEKVGRSIRKKTRNMDVAIVASTDFSHYVLKETAERKDSLAIDKILENDPKGLFDTVQRENISMCGHGPVISMMIGSGGTEGKKLKYATSGDIMPMKDVVGYGALAFE